jgi:GntR family transcriptional regulator, phosphonate transport system regulatory protein
LKQPATTVDRRNGVALWRQIADGIRMAISAGEFSAVGKLPGEIALAERFGVNRHTVRAAIASLEAEGVVEATPGRGTRILKQSRLKVPLSRRTRFSSGLSEQAKRLEMSYLSSGNEPCPPHIAEALALTAGDECVTLETLSLVDGMPVSCALHHFPASRFPRMDHYFRQERSITKAFAAHGLPDYVRDHTDITARHADETERRWLKLAPGAIVLESIAVNTDLAGVPVQYSLTRFAADRVSLTVTPEAGAL